MNQYLRVEISQNAIVKYATANETAWNLTFLVFSDTIISNKWEKL